MIVEYDCETCGDHVRKTPSPATIKSRPRFCSQACHGQARRGSGAGAKPNHEYDCESCGKHCRVYRSPSAAITRFCSLTCVGSAQSGEGNFFWTGAAKPLRNGYTRSYSFGRQVYTHRAVIEQSIGRRLESAEVVHHVNRDKTDNRIENLMLLPDQATHAALHAAEDRGF